MTEAAPAVIAAVSMWAKIVAERFADAKPAVLVLALTFVIKFAVG